MMAFSIENYFESTGLHDPRYLKWFAAYFDVKDHIRSVRELPVEPCKESDFAKFYPIDKQG